jgi:large subunit ribosomal protein L10
MLRKEKQAVAEDLKNKIEGASSIFLADFTGINVKDITTLRRDFRQSDIEYLVAKNTLIKRAIAGGPFEKLNDYLAGPTALVLTKDEGVDAVKIISNFSKDRALGMDVKVGVIDEKLIDAETVKSLASLPGREVLLARLLGGLNSPVVGFVHVLNGTLSRVVRVLDQVRQVKQSQENN